MIRKLALGIVSLGLMAFGSAAMATDYSGNGNSGFGGAVGGATLSLSDDGTTVSGTLTKGVAGDFNDVLVLYIDSTAGGFSDTSGFADSADGLRKAISGFDGGANRSTMTFAAGFSPDYAIALGPSSDSFGGLWQLANGGDNSLTFINSVGLSPTGTGTSATYTFSFNLSDIGLTPNSGASFELFGTYISDSGFRSDEAIAGNDSGTQGWNAFTQTDFGTYTTAVPEPATLVSLLSGSSLLGAFVFIRRRRS
jgi:PEP-CTERM motif